MTNSIIPYSFTPGTKANAGEVNANFNAVVKEIDATKTNFNRALSDLDNITDAKITKLKVIEVKSSDTDLDAYTTEGTYYFGSNFTPLGIPAGSAGFLKVYSCIQEEYSVIKQIWYEQSSDEEGCQTYMRSYTSDNWSDWKQFMVQDNVDGEYVDSYLEIQATTTSIVEFTADLSEYLPDDGENYWVTLATHASRQSDGDGYLYAWSSLWNVLGLNGSYVTSASTYSRHNNNTFDILIGADRTFKYKNTSTQINYHIQSIGYRRCGTNK